MRSNSQDSVGDASPELAECEAVLDALGVTSDQFVTLAMEEVKKTRACVLAVLEIANWRKRQGYRRKNPPWIKLYRKDVLDSYRHTQLSTKRRFIVLALGLVATECERDNEIPLDLKWLGKRMDTRFAYADLEAIVASGLVLIRPRRPADASETLPGNERDADSARTSCERDIARHEAVSEVKGRSASASASASGSEGSVTTMADQGEGPPVLAADIPWLG